MLKIGDVVSENGKVGVVVRIATKGTADVQFDDKEYPIRRQEHNLTAIRSNPMTLKKVPSRSKKASGNSANRLYVFESEQEIPIGDLNSAVKALESVLDQSRIDIRDFVIQGIQDAYPEYNWGSWWDKKTKRKPHLHSWNEYVNGYRIFDGHEYPLESNPFQKRSEGSSRSNPRRNPGWTTQEAARLHRMMNKSKYRKPQKSKGSTAEYGRKMSWAEGTGKYAKWVKDGLSSDEITEKVGKINLSSSKDIDEAMRMPISARIITQYVYEKEMMNKGQPYLMYRRAPIAAFFTIELFGPKYKFQMNSGGQKTFIIDRKKWRSPEWAGMDGFSLKEDISYRNTDADGNVTGTSQKSFSSVSCAFSPGFKQSRENGFDTQAISDSRGAVISAYKKWFDKHKDKLSEKDPKLVFPDDCLEPVYPTINCPWDGSSYSSIDPFLHFGVFIRALVSLLEFKEALQLLGRDTAYQLDLKNIVNWLTKQDLLEVVCETLESENINLSRYLLTSDSTLAEDANAIGVGAISDPDKEALKKIEKHIKDMYKPLYEFIGELNGDKYAASAEQTHVLDKIRSVTSRAKYQWMKGADGALIVKSIEKEHALFLEAIKESIKNGAETPKLNFDKKSFEITTRYIPKAKEKKRKRYK